MIYLLERHFILFSKRFYLFLEREEGREEERERNINVSLLSHAPYWGPSRQPRHVPCLGIKPAALGFEGWHSIH